MENWGSHSSKMMDFTSSYDAHLMGEIYTLKIEFKVSNRNVKAMGDYAPSMQYYYGIQIELKASKLGTFYLKSQEEKAMVQEQHATRYAPS